MTKVNFDRFGNFDEYAAGIAKRLAAVDRNRLKGGDVQFVAVLHSAIMEAIVYGHALSEGDIERGQETRDANRWRAMLHNLEERNKVQAAVELTQAVDAMIAAAEVTQC